jgi:SAM-dependent methyltransferase
MSGTLPNRAIRAVAAATRPVRMPLRRAMTNLRVRRHTTAALWEDGWSEEVGFWAHWFATEGDEWPQVYRERLDPATPLQDHIRDLLPPDGYVRILDVGAGPLTLLGKRSERHVIDITATDALADEYDRLLDRYGVVPPLRTIRCETEHLTERFDLGSFDLVNAENTLDHHYDALRAIDEMTSVTKPGGVIVMRHATDEAETARYTGLHQFNFALHDGVPVVWNKTTSVALDHFLAGRATRVDTTVTPSPRGEQWLRLVYRKL